MTCVVRPRLASHLQTLLAKLRASGAGSIGAPSHSDSALPAARLSFPAPVNTVKLQAHVRALCLADHGVNSRLGDLARLQVFLHFLTQLALQMSFAIHCNFRLCAAHVSSDLTNFQASIGADRRRFGQKVLQLQSLTCGISLTFSNFCSSSFRRDCSFRSSTVRSNTCRGQGVRPGF